MTQDVEEPGIVQYWLGNDEEGEQPPPQDAELLGDRGVRADEPGPVGDVGAPTYECDAEGLAIMPAVFPAMASMQLVKTRPDLDDVVTELKRQAGRAATYADKLTIVTLEDQHVVARDEGAVAGLLKVIEEKRLEYTGPLTELSRAINDVFKDMTDGLKEAFRVLKEKDGAFQSALDKLRAAAVEQEQVRLAQLAAKARETGEVIDQKPGAVLAQPPPTSIARTETSTRHFTTVPQWALVDEALVPRKWFILDKVAIGKAVRGGEKNIPGINIWDERKPSVRSR